MPKLKIPPGWIDDTAKGTVITIVGAEHIRKQIAAGRAPSLAERASWHESGHAICGRVLGFACGGASIRTDGTGSATVAGVLSLQWDLTRDGNILSSVFDKITVCWSGGVAESIMFGSADDRGDRVQIKQLAARYYVHDNDVERAHGRAHELIIKHWDAVERVATALLDKKTLTGAEINALCVAAAA
jgi:ATP-dependent Zn protease